MKNAAAEPKPPAKRAYRLGARAEAANAAGERMSRAFFARLREQWFEEIRLEDVARDAEVSVQTVIRHFGGKEGLLRAAAMRIGEEIEGRRMAAPGDVEGAIRAVIEDYEVVGDLVMRLLAQEDRHAIIRRVADFGRTGHREWVAAAFAPQLDSLGAEARQRRLDALVIATDLYLWKLVRRDMGRSVEDLYALMQRFVSAALADPA